MHGQDVELLAVTRDADSGGNGWLRPLAVAADEFLDVGARRGTHLPDEEVTVPIHERRFEDFLVTKGVHATTLHDALRRELLDVDIVPAGQNLGDVRRRLLLELNPRAVGLVRGGGLGGGGLGGGGGGGFATRE